jgi:hypothetical protein
MKPHAYRRPWYLRASFGAWLLALAVLPVLMLALYLLSEVQR